jgi:hypothetical protein
MVTPTLTVAVGPRRCLGEDSFVGERDIVVVGGASTVTGARRRQSAIYRKWHAGRAVTDVDWVQRSVAGRSGRRAVELGDVSWRK